MKKMKKIGFCLCLILVTLMIWIGIQKTEITKIAGKQQKFETAEEETVEVKIEQNVQKYFKVNEQTTLLQQQIIVEARNESIEKEKERLQIQVPILQGAKPKTAIVLMDGKKIEEEKYQYNTEIGNLQIEISKNNKLANHYKVIYSYESITPQEQEVELHTEAYVQIKGKEEVKVSDDKKMTVKEMGEAISAQIEMTQQTYKGYMYEKANHETEYEEDYIIEVSNIEKRQEINIEPENSYREEQGNLLSTQNSTIFKSTTIAKEDMQKILGEEGTILIKNEQNEEIAKLSKESQTNEDGDMVINYDTDYHKIIITTSTPIEEGTLKIRNRKAIKGNRNNTNEEIKTFVKLEERIQINESIATASMDLLESLPQAKIEMNKTKLETMKSSEEIEIHAILTTNHNSAKLYKNPILQITMPVEVEQISLVEEPYLLYEEELAIKDVVIEGRTVILQLEGEQTKYKDFTIEGPEITIKMNVTLNKKATNNSTEIYLNCINQDGTKAEAKEKVEIISPRELITTNNIEDLNIETIGETEKETAMLNIQQEEKQIKIQSEIINNKETTIKDVTVLGDMPTEPSLGATIASPIEVNGAEAQVYYTQNKQATDDLEDAGNQWIQSTEVLQTASKYLIKIETLDKKQSINLGYDVKIPSNLNYDQSGVEGYSVSYTNVETGINNTITSTYVTMTTGQGPKLSGQIKAYVGGEEIQSGDIVKRGEVVEYTIQVQNTGTEKAENVLVTCDIPEGMTLLEINGPDPSTGLGTSGGYVYEHDLYHELENKTFQKVIERIEIGSTEELTMLLKVKQVASNGEKAKIKAQINCRTEEVSTEEFEISKQEANLELTLKSTNDYSLKYQYDDYVRYSLFVKNISNETQNKVKIKLNLPEFMTLSALSIYKQGEEGTEEIDLSTNHSIEIEQIEPQQELDLKFVFYIGLIEEKRIDTGLSAYAEDSSSNIIRSNQFVREVYGIDIDLELTANKVNEYIKTDDIIEYKLIVKNNSAIEIHKFTLEDEISDELSIQTITQNGEEITLPENNLFRKGFTIEADSTIEFIIKTIVNHSDNRTEETPCINTARLLLNERVYEEVSLSNTIEKVVDESEEPNEPEEDKNGKYNLRGYAWIDSNANGRMEPNEEKVEGMKVNLLNLETNQTIQQETTKNNGEYLFSSLSKGKYMVIFEYDTARYSLSPYKKTGVLESENSKVVAKAMDIGKGKNTYGVTDVITISDGSISNINIGLVKEKEFDFQIQKSIKRIVVQNAKGSKVYTYHNADLAKLELDGKTINGTNLTIEYELKITNIGKVEGYVREIIDNLPTGLSFNSNINKDWYQLKGVLYNRTLANEKISVGESKTVALVLTKTMNTNSIGTYRNTASISESHTESGVLDIDANNNTSKADIIISIKTGQAYLYITLTITSIAMLAIGIYFIKKKILDKKI